MGLAVRRDALMSLRLVTGADGRSKSATKARLVHLAKRTTCLVNIATPLQSKNWKYLVRLINAHGWCRTDKNMEKLLSYMESHSQGLYDLMLKIEQFESRLRRVEQSAQNTWQFNPVFHSAPSTVKCELQNFGFTEASSRE